jgi:hypothetical protein
MRIIGGPAPTTRTLNDGACDGFGNGAACEERRLTATAIAQAMVQGIDLFRVRIGAPVVLAN